MAIDSKKAVERAKKQQDYINNYVREKYDRVALTLPKGFKNIIAGAGVGSVNGYITALIRDDLTRRGLLPADTSGSVSPSLGVPGGVPVLDRVEDTKNAGADNTGDIIPPFI